MSSMFREESDSKKIPPALGRQAWIWNKRDVPFVFTCDLSTEAEFPLPNTLELPALTGWEVPIAVALAARRQSLEQLHPDVRYSVAVRWPEGFREPDDPEFGGVIEVPKSRDLIDFRADPNPSNMPAREGQHTHPAELSVHGAAAAMDPRNRTLGRT